MSQTYRTGCSLSPWKQRAQATSPGASTGRTSASGCGCSGAAGAGGIDDGGCWLGMEGWAALTVLPGLPTFGRGRDGTMAAAERGSESFGNVLERVKTVVAVLGFLTSGLRMAKS